MIFNKYKRYGGYHWKWYARRQSYINHVNRLKTWIKEKDTLDIGAGDGLIVHELGLVEGVDNEWHAIKAASRRGVKIVLGDAYFLPFKDEQFTSVFMGDTLEHLEFADKALKEARRVLKQYLYLAVPIDDKRVDQYHYHNLNGAELKKLVEGQGFKLIGNISKDNNKMYAKFEKV